MHIDMGLQLEVFFFRIDAAQYVILPCIKAIKVAQFAKKRVVFLEEVCNTLTHA